MHVSNTFIDFNLQLTMDNTILQIVDAHRHLEVILTSNNKWNKYIDSIIESASKQLRNIVSRKTCSVNFIAPTYIRPLLEYASEVWNGCTQIDVNRLEQIQLTAAQIVTGLPVFSSLNSLYLETGWESLAERRKNKKLSLMYKIINNEAPLYLPDLLPRSIEAASNYNLRNSQNFEIPFTRLCSFETSFFPSTIRLWNNLDNPTSNATSLLQFKISLRQPPYKPHAFLTSQHRKQDIMLTRLQHN